MLGMLAVDPTLAAWGQASAIVIGLFALIFILIAVAFNFALAFALAWVRQKAELVHKLHPTVNRLNEVTRTALAGKDVKDENPVLRGVAIVPKGVHTIDVRTDGVADRVAQGVIEFRARTAQVVGVAKAFIKPNRTFTASEIAAITGEDGSSRDDREYRAALEKSAPEIPAQAAVGNGYAQGLAAAQRNNAPSR